MVALNRLHLVHGWQRIVGIVIESNWNDDDDDDDDDAVVVVVVVCCCDVDVGSVVDGFVVSFNDASNTCLCLTNIILPIRCVI